MFLIIPCWQSVTDKALQYIDFWQWGGGVMGRGRVAQKKPKRSPETLTNTQIDLSYLQGFRQQKTPPSISLGVVFILVRYTDPRSRFSLSQRSPV